MADGVEVKFNIPDFRRQLKQLNLKLARQVVGNAVRAGAREVVKAAKPKAPVLRKTDSRRVRGALKKSIGVFRSRLFSRKGVVAYFVGVRASRKSKGQGIDPFYWRFLESGWVPKAARSGRRKKSERTTTGQITTYRFLDPAFRGVQSRVLKVFVDKMEEGIAKAEKEIR